MKIDIELYYAIVFKTLKNLHFITGFKMLPYPPTMFRWELFLPPNPKYQVECWLIMNA